MTEHDKKRGLRCGWALGEHVDEVSGRSRNLIEKEDKHNARCWQGHDKPELLIVTPPCTNFSSPQNLNKGELKKEEMDKAIDIMELAVEVCFKKKPMKKLFFYEHLASAASWKLEKADRLRRSEGVYGRAMDMCEFEMVQCDQDGVGHVFRPMRRLTNSLAISRLSRSEQSGRFFSMKSSPGIPEICSSIKVFPWTKKLI